MNPSLPYLLGFLGGVVISVVVIILYERQNKQLRNLLEFTQRNLNSALSKMMAVDYEKLAEADIQARAMAQAAWYQTQGVPLPEMGDLDVFNPDDYRMTDDAK